MTKKHNNWKEYLPSNAFVLRAVFVLVCAGILVGLHFGWKLIKNRDGAGVRVSDDILIGDLVGRDTDGDGVLDWEESLWGTDLNLADTDGDGISDKEEVETKRKEFDPEGGDDANLTATDRFVRELNSTFIALKQTGKFDEQTATVIADKVTENIVEKEIPDIYLEKDLIVVENTDANKEKYNKDIISLWQRYVTVYGLGTELSFFSEALLEEANPDKMQTFVDMSVAYRVLGERLRKLSVPKNAVALHLEMVNNVIKISQSMESMKYFVNDPIKGASGLSQYKLYQDKLEQNLESLKLYF